MKLKDIYVLPFFCGTTGLMIDTRSLAVSAFGLAGLASSSLDNIRKFLRWETAGSHRAEKDMMDTVRLFLVCTSAWKRFWATVFRKS